MLSLKKSNDSILVFLLVLFSEYEQAWLVDLDAWRYALKSLSNKPKDIFNLPVNVLTSISKASVFEANQ